MSRAHISLKTKLASALLQLCGFEWPERLIPHEDAKLLSAEQIISLFQWHHYPIPKAAGGPDEPWNLQPELIVAHRKRTAEIDVPQIAKGKRITRKQEDFRRRILAKDTGEPVREQRRQWPKGQKIRSRGFQRRRT